MSAHGAEGSGGGAASAVLFVLLAGCASDAPPAAAVELVDIHGLAADAADPDGLYVATHRGLLRHAAGSWSHVGEARHDFMGFSAHPREPGVFWASGHPTTGGNLGVVHSTDGGATWTRIALEGVDFHALAVSAADPQRLFGSWRGEALRSDDGGREWRAVGALAATGFAPHPTERETVYAATGRDVRRSDDGGATWRPVAGVAALGLAVDPASPDVLYAATTRGVLKSEDAGAGWTRLALPHEGAFAHLATHVGAPGLVYAASYEKGIYRSDDHGATWTVVRAPS